MMNYVYVELSHDYTFRSDLILGVWPAPGGTTFVFVNGVGVVHLPDHPWDVHVRMGWRPDVPERIDILPPENGE